jgi:ribosomal protein S18 acetylase RimI-like enzyme
MISRYKMSFSNIYLFILSKLDSIIYIYKKKGIIGVFRAILKYLGFKHPEHLSFMYLKLSELSEQSTSKPVFKIITIQDIENTKNLDDGFHSRKEIIKKLEKGDLLFVHLENNNIAYYVWIEQKNISIDFFKFDLPNDITYLSGEFTVPEYRGKGIAKRTRLEIFRFLKENGFKYIILVVNPKNISAVKLNKSCGFIEYQYISYRKFAYLLYYEIKSTFTGEVKKFKGFKKPVEDVWKVFADFV